ncbi:MAG: amidohydrolase/deacetylase family metallohydrolase [Planctomycetaceae bacterium]
MQCDILVRGGEVIDPSQGLRGIRDVAITDGRVVAVEERIDEAVATHTVDARGLLVVPGLIDLHVHVYTDHIPIGIEADPLCPAGGVTTMLDAGSAGSRNFGGFRRDVIDRVQTQVFGLVNLASTGLIASDLGELRDRRYADPAGVVSTIAAHQGVAVGVKIRAGKHIIGEGEQGWENFREAVMAARESGTWLMVHIGESPMSIPEMLEHLEPGDCITHCFKGGSERILDPDDRVWNAVRDASAAGVVFDVGHGYGSFQWEVCQAVLDGGVEPTTISTDLHVKNLHGPVYDMPTTMSKFLHLGVPLERVIEMSTTRPAAVLGQAEQLGTLRVGTVADVAVLEKQQGRFVLTDSYRQGRVVEDLLIATATIRRGELVPGGGGLRMRHRAE